MRFHSLRLVAITGFVCAIGMIASAGLWLGRAASSTRERELIRRADIALAFADSLEQNLAARPPVGIATGEAVAALYLERLRMGLGSPFRLIDQAQRDPAVAPVGATELAESMLARTLMGDAYRSHSAALDLVNAEDRPGIGVQHQAIIDSVVFHSGDPRVGELTVRLAYRLAAASGAVSRRAPELATAAAAQARDRVLSMRDARALIAAADRDGVGRILLLRLWRASRRFDVERPVIVPLSAKAEREAVASLPALVARIERVSSEAEPFAETARNLYGQNLARRRGDGLPTRMAAVAAQRDLPPLAPVMIAVRGYSTMLRNAAGISERISRLRFVDRVSNEETLAAEYALLTARNGRPVPEADAAILTAGVALRPFAQERAWVQGDVAPTVRDLQSRFGVTVTFDATAHQGWRPFFQRSLETAILDMRRVFPGFDPHGLKVHFGVSPLGDRALALHDPIRRSIYFPPTSHSGVMAHEFAHDLDWQAARREYGGTGWYRTDHALRQAVDQLAGALRMMASATRTDTMSARMMGTARPTEVLARNVDWFVSASLAREGRVNGHLSAAQDPVLIGYASAITPEAAREGGSATLRALDGLTSVPPDTKTWFSGLYGRDRRLTMHEAVRLVLEAPIGRLPVGAQTSIKPWEPERFGEMLGGPSSNKSWTCLVEDFAGPGEDAGAIRAVVQYAAESRARGVLRQWADFARRRPNASPVRLRALNGAPWDPAIAESLLGEIRDAILWSALSGRLETGDGRWGTLALERSRC